MSSYTAYNPLRKVPGLLCTGVLVATMAGCQQPLFSTKTMTPQRLRQQLLPPHYEHDPKPYGMIVIADTDDQNPYDAVYHNPLYEQENPNANMSRIAWSYLQYTFDQLEPQDPLYEEYQWFSTVKENLDDMLSRLFFGGKVHIQLSTNKIGINLSFSF